MDGQPQRWLKTHRKRVRASFYPNITVRAPEKIHFATISNMLFFQHQNQVGNHHLQGKVQAYNVRIPAKDHPAWGSRILGPQK